ncbi:unnamed protein product [Adineta ricciae]|uniref:Beta-1,4-galactosyltransferase n=1 Tax=Adineta ricciae TaxID=249248 RepID=A0A815B0R5_ADIRI|nr:unnamed protein product [Adineta ricciae]
MKFKSLRRHKNDVKNTLGSQYYDPNWNQPLEEFSSSNLYKHSSTDKNNSTYNNTRKFPPLSSDSKLSVFFGTSFSASANFTKPDPSIYKSYPNCSFSLSNNDSASYRVSINKNIQSFNTIEHRYEKDLYPGGHFFPKTCRPKQRLAVIICYRNRESHLKLFLNHIHAFLQQQQLDYTIFVVNQHGQEQFNRAALFDVGFLEAIKLYSFDCFIFHDVDLLPEDLRNVYKCGKQPKHMSVAVDTFKYKLPYPTLFGGVTAISLTDFINANGYATIYWGWGGEDDDMYQRVNRTLRKSIARYPTVIARYQMICSHNHVSAEANPSRDIILRSNYDHKKDGLNSIKYVLHKLTFYRLFTLINVTLTEESLNEISKRMNIKFPKKTTTMKMRVLPRKSA